VRWRDPLIWFHAMSLTQSEQALLAYLRLDGDDNAEIVAQEPGAGSVSWDQLCNADMGPAKVREYCEVDEAGRSLLKAATRQLAMSARAFHRVLKLARTITDLAGSERL